MMRPIISTDEFPSNAENGSIYPNRPSIAPRNRPSISVNKPVINKAAVRSRLYEPPARVVNRKPPAPVNTAVVEPTLDRRPPPKKALSKPSKMANQNQRAKVEFNISESSIKTPPLKKMSPKEKLTFAERVTAVELAYKTAISQAEEQLASLVAELTFSPEELDVAAAYCDRCDVYTKQYDFYKEMIDLSQKTTEKLTALKQRTGEQSDAMHECTRFLALNLSTFRDGMAARQKAIDADLAKAKALEEAERERRNNDLSLYKTTVTHDVSVQVCPESCIYYSPNAGLLRSTTKKVVMPQSPVLRTCGRDMSTTPFSMRQPELRSARRIDQTTTTIIDKNVTCEVDEGSQQFRAPLSSRYARRLNFNESVLQEVENSGTSKLSRIAEVCESPVSIMRSNNTTLWGGRYDTNMKSRTATMPKSPLLLSDMKNFQ